MLSFCLYDLRLSCAPVRTCGWYSSCVSKHSHCVVLCRYIFCIWVICDWTSWRRFGGETGVNIYCVNMVGSGVMIKSSRRSYEPFGVNDSSITQLTLTRSSLSVESCASESLRLCVCARCGARGCTYYPCSTISQPCHLMTCVVIAVLLMFCFVEAPQSHHLNL